MFNVFLDCLLKHKIEMLLAGEYKNLCRLYDYKLINYSSPLLPNGIDNYLWYIRTHVEKHVRIDPTTFFVLFNTCRKKFIYTSVELSCPRLPVRERSRGRLKKTVRRTPRAVPTCSNSEITVSLSEPDT